MLRNIKLFWRYIRNNNKKLKLNLYSKLWDKKPACQLQFKDVKTVCLLRWDNKLGDAVMCSALIKALKQYRPDIKVSVITGKVSGAWLEAIEGCKVIYCPRRGMKTAKSFKQYAGMFDAVIDISNGFSEKELLALYSLNASYYIGYEKEDYNIFNIYIDREHVNFFERYQAVAKLFIDPPNFDYALPVPDYSQAMLPLQKLIDNKQENNQLLVAMNFFGSGKHRQFSLPQAVDLVNRWINENEKDDLLLIPVPDKVDFLAAVKTRCDKPERIINMDIACSINNTLAMLSLSDFCFTPDTSVVHMASATNTPTLAIYGGNQRNYQEWKPLAEYSQVLFNPEPKSRNDRVSVNHFEWDELMQARQKIVDALAGRII